MRQQATQISPVGYSILRIGSGETAEICLVFPFVQDPEQVVVDKLRRRLCVSAWHADFLLPELPSDVVRLITTAPQRVALVSPDCLSQTRFACRVEGISEINGFQSELAPLILSGTSTSHLNEFLTRAAHSGHLDVEHRRILARQPSNEVFVRKALVAMHKLAPEAKVSSRVTELVAGYLHHGGETLAAVVTEALSASPEMRRYVGNCHPKQSSPLNEASAIPVFCLLHDYAYGQLSAEMTAAPGFGLAVASSAIALSGQKANVRQRLQDAADSVYAQGFSDAYAIGVIAGFHGNDIASSILSLVLKRREAGGDFDVYSLAPLSQDSKAALEVMRAELGRGIDFSGLGRHQLMAKCSWIASEGLASWLQAHGVTLESAAAIGAAVETATHITVAASVAELKAKP